MNGDDKETWVEAIKVIIKEIKLILKGERNGRRKRR